MKEDKCNDKYCVLDKNHKGEHKWSSATWHQAVSDKETSGWEKEFDERYYNKGTPSGLNQDFRHMKATVDDIRFFIHFHLSHLKEQIEGMKRAEGSEWEIGIPDGDSYDEAIPYNQALEDVKALLDKEIR